jgi:hypothetical protein
MKPKTALVYILTVFTALPLVGTVAPAATVTVLQTFDYPDFLEQTTATLPQKISDQGDVVGTVIDVTGAVQGFIYKPRTARFSAAFHAPDDTGHVTQGRGINNRRHVVGEYLNGTDGTFHGYKLVHPNFVEFDIAGVLDTIPLGINNVGDFVGSVILSDGTQPAFVSLRQIVTMFAVPDATATFAFQLNTLNQIIGYYVDVDGITHGYTRDTDGTLTYPIDVPGSTGTILFGNNDSNWGVGRYTDAAGVTHGLYFVTPDDIQTYDYPDATFTSLNGINKQGTLCGYYLDAAGIYHGFMAKLKPGNADNPNPKISVEPMKPLHPWPEMLRRGEPAF